MIEESILFLRNCTEFSTCIIVIAIIFSPVFFKHLAKINKKILQLDYNYFPLPLKLNNFNLRYAFSKNIDLIILCESINISKKKSFLKISIFLKNLQITYQAKHPIIIGIDANQNQDILYREMVIHQVDSFFKERDFLKPFESLSYVQQIKYLMILMVKAIVTFLITLLLSFVEINCSKFTITLPQLYHETTKQVFPILHLQVQNSNMEFSLNREGNIQWNYQCKDDIIGSSDNHTFLKISQFIFSGNTNFALNVDLMFQNSKFDIKAKNFEFIFSNQTLFVTNIIWNEIYCSPTVYKCLKDYFQKERLLKIGHPQHMCFTIETLIFNFSLSEHLRYRKNFKSLNEIFQIYAKNFIWTFNFNYPLTQEKIRQQELRWDVVSSENGFKFKGTNQKKCQILQFLGLKIQFYTISTFRSLLEKNDITDIQIDFSNLNLSITQKFLRYMELFNSDLFYPIRQHFETLGIEKDLVRYRKSFFQEYALHYIKELGLEIHKDLKQEGYQNQQINQLHLPLTIDVNKNLRLNYLIRSMSHSLLPKFITLNILRRFRFQQIIKEIDQSRVLKFSFQELQIINQIEFVTSVVKDFTLQLETIKQQKNHEIVSRLLNVDTINLHISEQQIIELAKLQMSNQLFKASIKSNFQQQIKIQNPQTIDRQYRYSINTRIFSIDASSDEKRMLIFQIQRIKSNDFTNIKFTNLSLTDKDITRTFFGRRQFMIFAELKSQFSEKSPPFQSRQQQTSHTFFNIDRILLQNSEQELNVQTGQVKLKFDSNQQDLLWLARASKRIQQAVGSKAIAHEDEYVKTTRRNSLDDTILNGKTEASQDLKIEHIIGKKTLISINRIKMEISDTQMNQHILHYRQFMEMFKSGYPTHMREIDLINSLKAKKYSLVKLEVEGFLFTLDKDQEITSIDKIIDKIFELDSHHIDLDKSYFKMISQIQIQLSIHRMKLRSRDYFFKPLQINKLLLKSQLIITQINTSNISLSLRVFYDIQIKLEKLKSKVGLNLVFSLRELQKRLQSIIGQQEQKQKSLFNPQTNIKQGIDFWDRLRLKFHGRVSIDNQISQFGISTNILPYSKDCLFFKLQDNSIKYQNGTIKAEFNRITLNRQPKELDETSVINVPKVQILADLLWFSGKDQYDHYFLLHRPYLNQMNYCLNDFISKKFQLHFKVDCIQNETYQEYDKNMNLEQNLQECLYFHYQNSFFQWLQQLPILRNEVLRLYNIQLNQKEDDDLKTTQEDVEDDEEKKMQFLLEKQNMLNYANYFSLLSYTYSKLIESLRIQGSLYQHTEFLKFKIYAHKCRILFSNFQRRLKQVDDYLPFIDEEFVGIQLLLENTQAQLNVIPVCKLNQWNLKQESFVIKLSQITGAVFNGSSILQPTENNDQSDQESFESFFQNNDKSLQLSKSQSKSSKIMRSMTDFHEIKQYLRNKKSQFISDKLNTSIYHLFEDVNQSFFQKSTVNQQDKERHQFNAFAIFVNAQDILYEADKKVDLKPRHEIENEDDGQEVIVKLIQNFFTIKNCKFLFTFQLQELIRQVFEQVQSKTEEKGKVQPQENKKTETSIINSINQFVKSVAQQQEQKKPEVAQWGIPNPIQPEQIKQKVIAQEQIFLLVNLIRPQFNLQYHGANTQMILTSPQDCQFVISDYILPFDKFNCDKKRVCRFLFNGLECYMLNYHQDAKKKVYWMGKKGLEKLIHCDFTIFTYHYFILKESEIDFTQASQNQGLKIKHLWNQEMRREVVSVKVGQLISDLNSLQFEMFSNMLDFVEMATISTQEFEDMERSFKHKVQELDYHGTRNIEGLIKKKIAQVLFLINCKNQEKYGTEKSRLDYYIQLALVQLLDENDISFLQCKFSTIRVVETFYNNESRKSDILVQKVEVINRMFLGQDAQEYRQVLQQIVQTDKKTPIFRMVKKYFALPLYSQNSRWFVYDQYDVKINPVMIKLTDELYDKFYSYFFDKEIDKGKQQQLQLSVERYGKDKDKIKNMSANYNQKIPDLYQNIQVGELRLNVTFRHPSKLKRLKDVGVLIDPYVINKQIFWTTQELFDDFAAFIIKQVSSQIFSIIGQKLFGISREVTTQLTLE